MINVFLTGFPGFIGKRLALKLSENKDLVFPFLIHPSQKNLAEEALKDFKGKHRMVLGDITKTHFGLSQDLAKEIQTHTQVVFHLAAIYDLTVPKALAQQVNVWGTQNLLDFFSHSPILQRFNYISTCYVAGKEEGIVLPSRLKNTKGFHNFYESTKFEAEVIVEEKKTTMPITVFRPAIVVGDSKTGETDKFDGPYVVIRFLHKIRFFLRCVPNLGSRDCEVNTVPVDYLVSVMSYLSFEDQAVGKTYQICDPHSPSTEEFFEEIVYMIGGLRPFKNSFLKQIILKLLRLPGVDKITGITRQHLDYFSHQAKFRDENLDRDLRKSGISKPPYKKFYPILYQYMKEHV